MKDGKDGAQSSVGDTVPSPSPDSFDDDFDEGYSSDVAQEENGRPPGDDGKTSNLASAASSYQQSPPDTPNSQSPSFVQSPGYQKPVPGSQHPQSQHPSPGSPPAQVNGQNLAQKPPISGSPPHQPAGYPSQAPHPPQQGQPQPAINYDTDAWVQLCRTKNHQESCEYRKLSVPGTPQDVSQVIINDCYPLSNR